MDHKDQCPSIPYTFRSIQPDTSCFGAVPEQQERCSMKNKNIFGSMRCAFQGMQAAWKEERNFREYAAIYAVFAVLDLLLGVSAVEFMIGFTLVCTVFSVEYLNTALERLLDTKHPEISADNKFIKDTAAAGVFILSIAFFVSQAVFLLPRIMAVIL